MPTSGFSPVLISDIGTSENCTIVQLTHFFHTHSSGVEAKSITHALCTHALLHVIPLVHKQLSSGIYEQMG